MYYIFLLLIIFQSTQTVTTQTNSPLSVICTRYLVTFSPQYCSLDLWKKLLSVRQLFEKHIGTWILHESFLILLFSFRSKLKDAFKDINWSKVANVSLLSLCSLSKTPFVFLGGYGWHGVNFSHSSTGSQNSTVTPASWLLLSRAGAADRLTPTPPYHTRCVTVGEQEVGKKHSQEGSKQIIAYPVLHDDMLKNKFWGNKKKGRWWLWKYNYVYWSLLP